MEVRGQGPQPFDGTVRQVAGQPARQGKPTQAVPGQGPVPARSGDTRVPPSGRHRDGAGAAFSFDRTPWQKSVLLTAPTPTTGNDEDTLAASALSRPAALSLIANRYEIRDFLGRGGCGEVFEAYDRVLGRLVAVKVMPLGGDETSEGQERLRDFQMEARGVSRLSHPAIITVHDFGHGQGVAWIVMELVIGETLREALNRMGRLAVDDAVRIVCALLGALHYAHGRGVVHRDVKPGNILIEYSLTEDFGEVRLSDFGIARMGGEEKTIVGQLLGTPWFMAPEQSRGEAVDHRIDIWAAGIVLHEMLTGERAFNGPIPAIFHRIQTEEPAAPSALRPELPAGFDAVVAKALAKNPADRFATAQDMIDAILAVHHPQPPVGVTAEPSTRLWPEAWPLLEDPPAPPAPAVAPPPPPVRRAQGNWPGFALGLLAGVVLTLLGLRLGDGAGTGQAGTTWAAALPPVEITLEPAPAPALAAEGSAEPTQPDGAEPAWTLAALSPKPEHMPLKETPPPPAAPAVEDIQPAEADPMPEYPPQAVDEPENAELPPAMPEHAMAAPLPEEAAPPEAPPEHTPPEPTPTEPTSVRLDAPTVPALPACAPDVMRSRAGNHAGHGRIVFDWQRRMAYRVRPNDAGVEIEFPGAPCVPDLDGLALPRNVAGLAREGDRLLLQTARGNEVRHHRWQGRVVLDIQD